MGDLFNALGFVSANSSDNSKDEELQNYIRKLVNLAEIIKGAMGTFVKEIHVAPANIINLKLADLKDIEFYVLCDDAYEGEDKQTLLRECEEVVKVAVDSELGDVKVTKVETMFKYKWKVPTFCLFSTDSWNIQEPDEFEVESLIFKDIRTELQLGVSITYSSFKSLRKCIVLHFKDAIDIMQKREDIEAIGKKYYTTISSDIKKRSDITYIALVGLGVLSDDLPYKYFEPVKVFENNFSQSED